MGGNSCQGDHLVDATGGAGGAGHAIDHGAVLVLGEHMAAGPVQGDQAVAAVLAYVYRIRGEAARV